MNYIPKKRNYKYSWLLFFISCTGYAASGLDKDNYWQCVTHDQTNKVWTAKNIYQKAALNIAFEYAKKKV